jgi:type IV pilus assembly protein PilC
MERMFRILAATLHAGVDLPDAMDVAAASATNVVYRNAFLGIKEDATHGQTLTDPMIRTKLFPATATQMFRAGEETATLDHQVEVAANYQKLDLETRITRAMAALEPALTIAVGTLVLFVSIALISAMYGAFSQVHLQ